VKFGVRSDCQSTDFGVDLVCPRHRAPRIFMRADVVRILAHLGWTMSFLRIDSGTVQVRVSNFTAVMVVRQRRATGRSTLPTTVT